MSFFRRSQKPPQPPTSDSPPTTDPKNPSDSDSDSEASSDSEPPDEAEIEAYLAAFRAEYQPETYDDSELDPEKNFKDVMEAFQSEKAKKKLERNARKRLEQFNPFDFPPDKENWTEEDLRELWDDGNNSITGAGWDPDGADEEEWDYVLDMVDNGKPVPIAPFYVPYRKNIPPIPDNHSAIKSPMDLIEELDRIEEFLKWVSYVFEDGTVWDDVAQGRGVYSNEDGLVRYEGEWHRNDPEGHGVVEVEIPVTEPVSGSKLEKKMRAQERIIKRDFMSPEEREWLDKDIEDSYHLSNGYVATPFYESKEWLEEFEKKPEKGRYRYAGQWKHGLMHGCGVYEVNERIIYGRFYFGEILDNDEGCDDETSALHAGIAEVAAAKARMFVNKPDGMVREKRGPYNDPQHAYLYEGEDVWMSPGFINQFYEVPDYWKRYAHEVDQEREMWLNSFYRSPLRIPMPAELEYWWNKEENHELPEFVVINEEPKPDPEDPSNLIYPEDPLIVHTPTGYIINYVEDEKHGIRMFWQPPLENDENVDPKKVKPDPTKAKFLPLGYDEYFGIDKKEKNIGVRVLLAIGKVTKPWFDKVGKWVEEKKKTSEMKKEAIEKELELIEAELCLEEAIEDMEGLLRRREKEEKKKSELGLPDEDDTTSVANLGSRDEDDTTSVANLGLRDEDETISVAKQDVKARVDEEEEEDDEEDEDDSAPSSFGSIEQEQKTDEQNGKPGKSPFSATSLTFASSSLISAVPSKLQQSFSFWNKVVSKPGSVPVQRIDHISDVKRVGSVSFPCVTGQNCRLKAAGKTHEKVNARSYLGRKFHEASSMSHTRPCNMASASSKSNSKEWRMSGDVWLHAAPEMDLDNILSLHSVSSMYDCNPNIQREPHFKFKF
ncbi:hypothetical protein TSUD_103450 [Trifolium subterraneum]|uniref:MORN repeat-containing protein n=1 Tax=Trifolium subterraneum TaxID=3900 RepID=A0A2Z6NEB2_TRISU|nr:hypothetical protein TSUD_103450 [Trifolium subterraneum]